MTANDILPNTTRRQRPIGANPIYWASNRTVPVHEWDIKYVADLATTFKGKLPSELLDKPTATSLPYLLMEGLRGGSHVFTEHTSLPRVTATDTVVIADGSKSGFAVRGVAGILGSTLLGFHAKENVDSSFLYHTLASLFAFLNSATTGTAIPHLDQNLLLKLPLAIPPPAEQAAIARILDAADAAIERTRDAIARARELRRALIQDLLTKGIDENGAIRDLLKQKEAFHATEIGLLPRTWRVQSLKDIAEVERGKFTPRPRNDPRYYGGEFPFVQTGQVVRAQGRILFEYEQTLNELGKSVSREFPVGTILITIAANIGDTTILGIPMCVPDSLVGAEVAPPNNPRFIELCLRRLKPRLLALAPRSAQHNINLTTLRPLRIPIPPAEEQDRIAKVYETSEALIIALEDKTKRQTTLKQSLMHDLLSGSVRVKAVKETEQLKFFE